MEILFIVISFCLFLFAPAGFGLPYCFCCAGLFVLMFVLVMRKEFKDKIYFSFNLLFWISMFCATFIVPLFVLPAGFRSVLDDYANKCTAMTVFAMSLYYFGWCKAYGKKNGQLKEEKIHIIIPFAVVKILRIFTVLVSLLYVYQFVVFFRTSSIYDNDIGLGFTYTLIQSILCSALIVSAIYFRERSHGLAAFASNNMIILICYAIIIITSVFIGDRTMPIYLSLCIMGSYIFYVKKMGLITQWGLIVVAAAVMVTIGKTRTTSDNFREGGLGSIASTTIQTVGSAETTVDLFSDFMPATRALYACADWRASNNNRLFYPLKIIKTPFAPIPYLPTILSRLLFDKENDELSSASLTTRHFSDRVSQINGGLGTHAVGDIYVSWGTIGIIIFFYLFGYLIGTSQRRIYDNVYWAVTYFALLCNALYIPRASILDNYRAIAFELFFIWLASQLASHPIKNNVIVE